MGGGDASLAKGGGLAALGAADLRVVRGGMLGLANAHTSKTSEKREMGRSQRRQAVVVVSVVKSGVRRGATVTL